MLSNREKLSYGVGALGKDLACSIVMLYIMFYLTDIMGISPLFVGNIMFIARFWDAINDTLMGVVVDNTRSRWGKFRPWILVGTIINAITIILLFRDPGLTGNAKALYFGIMYILWGMTYTIMDIPYWSMLPSLSTNPEERNKIAVIPRIFASLAWLIMGAGGLLLIDKLGNAEGLEGAEKIAAQAQGYEYFAVIIAAVFMITSVITILNVKERGGSDAQPASEKVTFKKALRIIKGNDQLIAFVGIVLAYNLISQLTGGVALYYFKYVIGNEGLFSVYQGFSGVAEIAGLLVFPLLAQRISRTKVYGLACTLPIFGFLGLFISGIVAPESAILIGVSGIVFKLGSGLALGASTVMLADVVDYGEYKMNTRNESIVFSIQTMLVKFASAISGYIIGVGLTVIGFVPNTTPSETTVLGLRFLMIGVPIILAILSFVLFYKFFKIRGAFHATILKELEQRREAQA